jgi:hypothetical protein
MLQINDYVVLVLVLAQLSLIFVLMRNMTSKGSFVAASGFTVFLIVFFSLRSQGQVSEITLSSFGTIKSAAVRATEYVDEIKRIVEQDLSGAVNGLKSDIEKQAQEANLAVQALKTDLEKQTEDVKTAVNSIIYTTVDLWLDFSYEVDLTAIGLDSYKSELENLLETARSAIDKKGNQLPTGCVPSRNRYGTSIVTCGTTGDPSVVPVDPASDFLNLPRSGFQIVDGKGIYFHPYSVLGLNNGDEVIGQLIRNSGIAIRFFHPPDIKPESEFSVRLEELLNRQNFNVIRYEGGKLIFNSAAAPVFWTVG